MDDAAASRRRLGVVATEVSALGFGGVPIGNLYTPVSDWEARDVVDACWDAGVRLYDTAPLYGYGLSERRLGDALRSHPRGDYVLSTKVGRLLRRGWHPSRDDDVYDSPMRFHVEYDYSYDGVMRSLEASYHRLGLDRIDVVLFHDLGRMEHGENHKLHMKAAMESGYRALDELRSSGEIGAIGLGVNEAAVCLEAMESGRFDCFLLAGRYTLVEQEVLHPFLARCVREDVKIIIGGPFNSGILARGVDDASTFNYAPAPADIRDHVQRMGAVCRQFDTPLGAAAIQFPLAHPAVACVIPGARSREEVLQNAAWMAHPIPDEMWVALKERKLVAADAPVPGERAA